jgi:hypothetical protein
MDVRTRVSVFAWSLSQTGFVITSGSPELREFLSMAYTPKKVAARVGCSLSRVYVIRGRIELAVLKHQVTELRLAIRDIYERLTTSRKHVA